MLISRRTFPPGGFPFYQPQTNWPPLDQINTYFSGKTFDQVVEEIIKHRLANPRFHLATDPPSVGNELDFFTCARLKWDANYCTGGPTGKVMRPLPQSAVVGKKSVAAAVVEKVKKYVSGIGVLLDWLGGDAKAVPNELSNSRAAICKDCPKNKPGDWETFFTGLAAEKIRQQLQVRNEMKLATEHDDRLNICEACLCHLRLKVHVPIEHVLKKLKPDMKLALDDRCWILAEMPNVYDPALHGNLMPGDKRDIWGNIK